MSDTTADRLQAVLDAPHLTIRATTDYVPDYVLVPRADLSALLEERDELLMHSALAGISAANPLTEQLLAELHKKIHTQSYSALEQRCAHGLAEGMTTGLPDAPPALIGEITLHAACRLAGLLLKLTADGVLNDDVMWSTSINALGLAGAELYTENTPRFTAPDSAETSRT